MVPKVQVKLLAALAVNEILLPAPLHMVFVEAVVTTGIGLTVTVMAVAAPVQVPVVDVGVTTYSTVPALALLGLVNV